MYAICYDTDENTIVTCHIAAVPCLQAQTLIKFYSASLYISSDKHTLRCQWLQLSQILQAFDPLSDFQQHVRTLRLEPRKSQMIMRSRLLLEIRDPLLTDALCQALAKNANRVERHLCATYHNKDRRQAFEGAGPDFDVGQNMRPGRNPPFGLQIVRWDIAPQRAGGVALVPGSGIVRREITMERAVRTRSVRVAPVVRRRLQ